MGVNSSKYQALQDTKPLEPEETLDEILSVVDDQDKKYILKEFYAMFPDDKKKIAEVIKEIRHYTLRELMNYFCRRMRQASDIVGLSGNRMHAYWSLILEVKMILKSRGEW